MLVKGYPQGGQWRRKRPKGGHSASVNPDPRALQPVVLSSLHRRPPPRLSTCGCVTRLLVVLGSKNELPSRKPPLGDVGWSPILEVSGPATAKSSPTFLGRVFSSAAPLARQLRLGMGGRPRLLALLSSTASGMEGLGALSGRGVLADGDGTDWGTQGRGPQTRGFCLPVPPGLQLACVRLRTVQFAADATSYSAVRGSQLPIGPFLPHSPGALDQEYFCFNPCDSPLCAPPRLRGKPI